MDEDDVMLPDRLETQLRYLEENEKILAVGGQLILIDKNDKPIGVSYYREEIKKNRSDLLKHSPIAHPASMFRLNSVRTIGGYRDFLPEDWDLWIRLREIGPIGNLKLPVLKYRVHEKQLSRENIYTQKIAQQYVSVSYFARKFHLRDHPLSTERREEWMENTKKQLKIVSSEYREFEKRSEVNNELESILQLVSTKRRIRRILFFGLRHPRLSSTFLVEKLSAKLK